MEQEHEQPGPKRKMLAETIERQTRRRLSIDAVETPDSLAKAHPQPQSPFFAVLPREIRDLIWALATSPSEDDAHAYSARENYYRPGHTAPWRSDTTLLLTCRRIWLEANPWPMLQAEHCFWYYRAAPDGRDARWKSALTPLHRRHFGRVHLFAQMFAIEGLGSAAGLLRRKFLVHETGLSADFQPRCFHVTIRHTDWWWWEGDEPLRLEDSWVQALLETPDLRSTQVLKLELETLDYKVVQLMPIAERLEALRSAEYETHVVDGQPVTTTFVREPERSVSTWTGPTDFNNSRAHRYKDRPSLTYHVVTLTWKLAFPRFPHAHIPTLRLGPRIELEVSPPSEADAAGDDEPFEWYGVGYPWGSSSQEEELEPEHAEEYRDDIGTPDEEVEPDDSPWGPMYEDSLEMAASVRAASQHLETSRFDSVRDHVIQMVGPVVGEMWKDEWEERFKRQNSLLHFAA